MGRRTLLLIASILVAALGTSLIWLYVQGADTRAKEGQDLVQALFLNAPMAAGAAAATVVAAATPKSVPADVAGTDAVTSPAQVAGLNLSSSAVAGQILLKSMFTSGTPSGAPNGRGFVSITISDPHRVPAQLRAGQQVAVYALGRGKPQLVADRITVVSVGTSTTTPTTPGGTGAAPTIVAFDATPEQAVALLAIEPDGEQPALYLLGPGTTAAR